MLFSYYKFRITSRVKIRNANKFLFILTSNFRQDIITFFYLFDLFENLFIILFGYYSLQYDDIRSVKVKVMINSESM